MASEHGDKREEAVRRGWIGRGGGPQTWEIVEEASLGPTTRYQ